MAKSKRPSANVRPKHVGPPDARKSGLRMFNAGRFADAITTWSPLLESDPAIRSALAEAHFRKALTQPCGTPRLGDLRRALDLVPDEPRYLYQQALALHHTGDLNAAIALYQQIQRLGADWDGVSLLLALARLEQEPHADVPAQLRDRLAPAQALLRGSAPAPTDDAVLARFWQGLGQIDQGDGSALAALDDSSPLPSESLLNLRRYYAGVAAAQAGQIEAVEQHWLRLNPSCTLPARFSENLSALLYQRLNDLLDAGEAELAAALVAQTVTLRFSGSALNELRVLALDRGAQAAVARGDWPQATAWWEAARQVVSSSSGLGSPRPLLYNLALAYEQQEQWLEAADMWRGVMRTRPRRKASTESETATAAEMTDAQWAWVRNRIIECYKRAGRPGEAVTVFRQALKAEPDDLDMRLQLADALLANEQEQAAINEIQRILDRDPTHVDARMRQAAYLSLRYDFPQAEQILRDVLVIHPEREDARRLLAQLLLTHGSQLLNNQRDAAAEKLFQEGQKLDPENYQFPLNLARVAFNRKKPSKARPLLDQALDLAADQLDAYVEAVLCWVIEEQPDDARAVISRAEASTTPTPQLYLSFGTTILSEIAEDDATLGFALFEAPRPKARATAPNPAWMQLATEMFDKGFALAPDDARLRSGLAYELMLDWPDLALRYAEDGVRMLPDDPRPLIILGIVQGLRDEVRPAKEALRRAQQLARKRGEPEIAEEADELRRIVGTPMLRFSLQMQSRLRQVDFDEDDLYL